MFRPFSLLLSLLLLLTFSTAAPVYKPGTVIRLAPRTPVASNNGNEFAGGSWMRGLPRMLRRFLANEHAILHPRATPAGNLTSADLGKCLYVGSDFLMHDCNEVADPIAASLNAARTEEQRKIVAVASASFAAKLAAASAAAEGKVAAAVTQEKPKTKARLPKGEKA